MKGIEEKTSLTPLHPILLHTKKSFLQGWKENGRQERRQKAAVTGSKRWLLDGQHAFPGKTLFRESCRHFLSQGGKNSRRFCCTWSWCKKARLAEVRGPSVSLQRWRPRGLPPHILDPHKPPGTSSWKKWWEKPKPLKINFSQFSKIQVQN